MILLFPLFYREIEKESKDTATVTSATPSTQSKEKCSRNFLIFTDDTTARNYFSIPKKRPPQRLICPITRQKARYFDPITQTPFANIRAYKCLREALRQQLANKDNGATVVIEQKISRPQGSSK